MEIPFDLIKQVQISLRNHANLSSYDPDDASFADLPSPEEAIAALDPSPPYLRCKHCKGRLLRGLQSLICVFCGGEACKDLPPDPINFRNTVGYGWLLESLNLDGSEIVAPPVEANNSHRGRTAPKDEFPLSELLDLEIKWLSESENFDTRPSNETSAHGKSSLNLSGVKLENFFAKEKKNSASDASVEPSVTVNQIVAKETIQGHGNLDLFENAQPSEIAIPSSEDETSYSNSGWGANFQSAASTALSKESTSFDAFEGSADLSTHMDEVFGPAKDSIDRKDRETIGSASMASDWFVDDSRNSSNSGLTGPQEEFKMNTNGSSGSKVGTLNYTSSMDVDWVQQNRSQSNSNKESDSKADEGNDSFDDWNDFTSSPIKQDPSNSSSKQTALPSDDKTSETNLFGSANQSQDVNFFNSFSQSDLFSGAFSSPNASTEENNMLSETSVSNRASGANAMVGGNPEPDDVGKGTDVSKAETRSKTDDVDMLMSQMHDLSFMLETNLSIPSTQEGFNSLSLD